MNKTRRKKKEVGEEKEELVKPALQLSAWNRGVIGKPVLVERAPGVTASRGPAEQRHTLTMYRAERPGRSPPCFISSGS